MTACSDLDGEVFIGHVKWFDTSKGFGFLRGEGFEDDILIHANVLRNFGQSSVSDGSLIRFRVSQTRRGFQASEIIDIEAAPQDWSQPPSAQVFADIDLESSPLVPARVKWFDRVKGFGFANVFGKSDDVFIHIDVLRRSALSDLQPGEAVAIRVAEGERGHLATQVSVWESAHSSQGSPD